MRFRAESVVESHQCDIGASHQDGHIHCLESTVLWIAVVDVLGIRRESLAVLCQHEIQIVSARNQALVVTELQAFTMRGPSSAKKLSRAVVRRPPREVRGIEHVCMRNQPIGIIYHNDAPAIELRPAHLYRDFPGQRRSARRDNAATTRPVAYFLELEHAAYSLEREFCDYAAGSCEPAASSFPSFVRSVSVLDELQGVVVVRDAAPAPADPELGRAHSRDVVDHDRQRTTIDQLV